MTERRRFNDGERAVLYLAADGKCQCAGCGACRSDGCGTALEPGWHADHDQPWSLGGDTDVANGRALCPPCNLRKGDRVHYGDTFQARPFQREVINGVLDGITSGRNTTIVLASPGSGKTLAYQAAATYAYREGLADLVAVFVPRIILAQTCETSWLHRRDDGSNGGDHLLFDAKSRLGRIRHAPIKPPLTSPDETGVGFVATYSALCSSDSIYMSWARHNKGRFLLIADEAQFCGASNDERSGGTKAGTLITDLHEMAAHTLLMTGTPYRCDGQRLILAEYEEADEEGKRRLLHHAKADYRDGVREGYLRRFEATLHDARIRWKGVDNRVTEYDLSTSSDELSDILRKPEVWQPIADGVVNAVREKQHVNGQYRGLISCMDISDAKRVYGYLTRKYPELRVLSATSDDGPSAERDLKTFRSVGGDVLVTVRKAFIGYDCPEIAVVGILTHYRDQGHLEQLVGRGLRTWKGAPARSQSCRVIAPDDPRMTAFIEYMRGESEQGLREREARERENGERNPPAELGFVESAHLTTARAVSNDTDLDNDQRVLIEAIKHDIGSVEDVTVLARFAELMALSRSAPGAAAAPAPGDPETPASSFVPLTEQEQIGQIGALTAEVVRDILSAQGIKGGRPDYGEHVQRVTGRVNTAARIKAPDCRTVEQAQARLAAAREIRSQLP